MKRNWLIAAAIVGAAALAVPGIASAGWTDAPPTYTGCLNGNGKFERLQQGSTPKQPCEDNQQVVHLSGGDLTGVVAGAGVKQMANYGGDVLTDVDGTGMVGLELEQSYRLPQNCSAQQLPQWSNGSWTCTNKPAPAPTGPQGKTFVGIKGGPGVVGNSWSTVGSLTVPAGSYEINAKVNIADAPVEEDVVQGHCRLDATGSQWLDAAWVSATDDDGFVEATQIALMSAITKAESFNIAVLCQDSDLTDTRWDTLRIVATQVGQTEHVNL